MRMNKGILVVISGFSGAGKGTLMKALLAGYDNYALSVSATTRAPREGEQDGREYFFLSKEQFEEMIRRDELVEYAKYVENYYGTPKAYVQKQLAAGKDVILEIEIQGALIIKKKFPDALLIFISAPNAEELRRRLECRGTETEEIIRARLCRAAEEANGMMSYDYIVINDEVESCAEKLHQTIQAAHRTPGRNLETIETMQQELGALSKGER